MNEKTEQKKEIQKKSSRKKYIIAAGIALLFITPIFIVILIQQQQKSDPISENIIRQAAAKILNKDPNELVDEDFAKITEFSLSQKEISDLKLLEKFTNLEFLALEQISYPPEAIPKWVSFFAKLGIIDIDKKMSLDLNPIAKLNNLKYIIIFETPVTDIKPLAGLPELRTLFLQSTMIKNLDSLKGRTSLEGIYITDCHNITDQQIERLRKALPNLEIIK